MTEGDHMEAVRRYWEEVWNRASLDALHEFYAPTFRLNGETGTPQELRDGVVAQFTRFPDLATVVEECFAARGNRIVSRVTYRGTNQGDFPSMKATGRRMMISGIDIFRFEGDQVIEHWHEADHYAMFLQLGATLTAGG